MIVSILALLLGFSPQAKPAAAPKNYVVSVVNERAGDDFSVRFVLSGPPGAYSAKKDGEDIVVRIDAEPMPTLSLPAPSGPVRSLEVGPAPGFSVRVKLSENRPYELVRESTSVRLLFKKRVEAKAAAAPLAAAAPDALAAPSPSPTPAPAVVAAQETADLYRRLFPATEAATTGPLGGAQEMGVPENWYSDTKFLGVQIRPWVTVAYVDAKTTEVQVNQVTADSYWVIQPNIGIGISPRLGGDREGQWRLNYSPRFRRQLDISLPHLASHFIDISIDQPLSASLAIYGTYRHSQGVLETDEIDPGREYGIGLNRVVDTSLERFKRNSFGGGVTFDFLADTKVDVHVDSTKVLYGNDPGEEPPGERAFFDYDTRTLNASLRRGLGASRVLGLLFSVHDMPTQPERKQVEGRGYTYGVSIEGQILALTTGRIQVGYRTQKNPNAGVGGQEYKDFAYGLQIAREIRENTSIGISADRRLYLSNYKENGFYVANTLRADLNTRLPFEVYLRAGGYLQSNGYEASPQLSDTTGELTLRDDKLRGVQIGLTRSLTKWAYLRFDYGAEKRDSNLDRFDIKTHVLTFQLGLGYFGKGSRQGAPAW
jgi:hypothetical protein